MFEINPAKKKKKNFRKRKCPASLSSSQTSMVGRISKRSTLTTPYALNKSTRNYREKSDSFPYAFRSDFLDHFETPEQAYIDIERYLDAVASRMKIKRSKLRIYDPYFCRGAVKSYLGNLGFTYVYNENEDFYKSERYRNSDMYDVVVTNPPYSGSLKLLSY